MCETENVQTLQRGMNYRLNDHYSVILMSQRSGAPYKDKIYDDQMTIEYEGHDVSRNSTSSSPKVVDQVSKLPSGKLTQNGLFIKSVNRHKQNSEESEVVRVYEKIMSGTWSLKGNFELFDYKIINDGHRNVFKFILKLSDKEINSNKKQVVAHTINRVIPSSVKREVWKRDGGKCVICGSNKNLHFDHELPFSKGGTSLTAKNVRILCMSHNLSKSARIE